MESFKVNIPQTDIKVQVVAVGPEGPEGPQGEQGPRGIPGPAGNSEDAISYTHYQMVPSDEWTIPHNLNFFPGGILVQDSAGSTHVGEVTYIDRNTLRISFFAGSFSGTAYLS